MKESCDYYKKPSKQPVCGGKKVTDLHNENNWMLPHDQTPSNIDKHPPNINITPSNTSYGTRADWTKTNTTMED